MKKFTIKDLLLYNSKCFSCDSLTKFKVYSVDNEQAFYSNYLTIDNDSIIVNLSTSWKNNFSFKIDLKTNSFETSNIKRLLKFNNNNAIEIVSKCTCRTEIIANNLEFDFVKMRIAPATIKFECILVKEDNFEYSLITQYEKGCSLLILDEKVQPNLTIINRGHVIKKPKASIQFKKIMPLYKFKDRNEFLKKMKVYLSLS